MIKNKIIDLYTTCLTKCRLITKSSEVGVKDTRAFGDQMSRGSVREKLARGPFPIARRYAVSVPLAARPPCS